ncbi:MAG: helix-turn-helix domain-containing protein [Planctomycetota bacterium]
MRSPTDSARAVFTATTVTRPGDGPSWAEIVTSNLGTALAEAVNGEEGFYGNLEIWNLGCLQFAHVKLRGVSVRGVRKPCAAGYSANAHLWVAVALAGSFDLDYAGHTALMTPGTMAVLDVEKTYMTTFAPNNDVLWIRVPRIRLQQHLSRKNQIIIDGSRGVGRVAFESLKAVLDEASNLRPDDGDLLAEGIVSLLGAAANGVGDKWQQISNDHRAATLWGIKKYIIENLSDDSLSSRTIAEAYGLSPRYINKLFEEEDTSLMRWTWKQRLERAKDSLIYGPTTGRSISDVAFALGFKSASHFSHAFRKHFGYTPSSVRELKTN